MSIPSYPRESVEFQPVPITLDGAPYAGDFEVAITPYGTRPATWAAAIPVDGAKGIMITGLSAGLYTVWAKVTDTPETPVIECGLVLIT